MSTLFTESFFEAFMSHTNIKGAIKTLIDSLQTLYPQFQPIFKDITDANLKNIADTFDRIGHFFSIPFKVIVRIEKGDVESIEMRTYGQTFQDLKSMHIHQNIHHNVTKTSHSCKFHKEELFDHLIMCGMISCIIANKMNLDPFIAALAGILHDIGKPGCIHLFPNELAGYPYHGEYGAIIIARVYSKSFEPFVSKESWEMICRLLTTHMCSYHLTTFTSEWEQNRINSCRFDENLTKQYSMALSYGDIFSAISEKTNHNDFIDSRSTYFEEISKPFICNKQKFFITLDGLSGSGKSTVADMLIQWYNEQNISVGYVARDIVMCDLVSGMMNSTLKNIRPTAEEYSECFAYYKKNGLGKTVNTKMQREIRESIKFNEITIVDTQLTLFKYSSAIIPSNIPECTHISIDVSRNEKSIDNKKNGLNLADQLKLSGISTFLKPFNVDLMDVFRLQSKYCSKMENIDVNLVDYKFQICSNSEFYGLNSIGLDTFKNLFMKIYSAVNRNINTNTNTNINTNGINLNKLSLPDLFNYVYNKTGKSYKKLGEFFHLKDCQFGCPTDFRDTPYSERVALVKYKEHNQEWYDYVRDARGTVLFLNDDDMWVVVKYLLERGAEMLLDEQIRSGITETENIDMNVDFKCSNLSPKQQSLVIRLATNGNVNLKTTMKKDGSLLALTRYSEDFGKVVREVINLKGDKFTKTVMNQFDVIYGSTEFTVVFQSQGTMILGEFMYDYTTTACFPE